MAVCTYYVPMWSFFSQGKSNLAWVYLPVSCRKRNIIIICILVLEFETCNYCNLLI